jgi:hypothetical protein
MWGVGTIRERRGTVLKTRDAKHSFDLLPIYVTFNVLDLSHCGKFPIKASWS